MENSKITYFNNLNLTINGLTDLERVILVEISNNSKVEEMVCSLRQIGLLMIPNEFQILRKIKDISEEKVKINQVFEDFKIMANKVIFKKMKNFSK